MAKAKDVAEKYYASTSYRLARTWLAQNAMLDGKLKFRLDGEKLHGSWALVRMGGRAGDDGKNWLLIKHDEEAAVG